MRTFLLSLLNKFDKEPRTSSASYPSTDTCGILKDSINSCKSGICVLKLSGAGDLLAL